jgi:hypothetical protein
MWVMNRLPFTAKTNSFGVELKPLFLGKVRRIEGPVPPMGIIIAARPDEYHPLTLPLSPLGRGMGGKKWQLI